MRLPLVAILFTAVVAPMASAETIARPGSADPRVLLATYRNNEIYTVVGTYGFQTTVEFSSEESVETVSIGDSVAWQVVPAGHRVFLKPQEPNAVTNMTVVTSQRSYYFDLSARKNRDPAGVTYLLRFTYPEGAPTVVTAKPQAPPPTAPAKKPTDYNFDYSTKGARDIAPVRVFDDGEFTYMQFASLTDLPAVFLVDKDKQESVVNYRIEGPYVVIERIGRQFSLRHGNEVACVYNRSAAEPPGEVAEAAKRDHAVPAGR